MEAALRAVSRPGPHGGGEAARARGGVRRPQTGHDGHRRREMPACLENPSGPRGAGRRSRGWRPEASATLALSGCGADV